MVLSHAERCEVAARREHGAMSDDKAHWIAGTAPELDKIQCTRSEKEDVTIYIPADRSSVCVAVLGVTIAFSADDARKFGASVARAGDALDAYLKESTGR